MWRPAECPWSIPDKHLGVVANFPRGHHCVHFPHHCRNQLCCLKSCGLLASRPCCIDLFLTVCCLCAGVCTCVYTCMQTVDDIHLPCLTPLRRSLPRTGANRFCGSFTTILAARGPAVLFPRNSPIPSLELEIKVHETMPGLSDRC